MIRGWIGGEYRIYRKEDEALDRADMLSQTAAADRYNAEYGVASVTA